MVLSCYETPTCFEVHTRVIDGSMAELQLVGFRSSRQPKNLGAQADSHYRDLGLHQTPGCRYGSKVGFRVSRSITNNDPPRIQFEDLVDWKVVGDADNSCPLGEKATQYPIFDTAVHDYDSRLFLPIIVDRLLGT